MKLRNNTLDTYFYPTFRSSTFNSGHLDQHFVSQLCNNFKFGVHIGFQGQRAPRFSRNLPTALANPDIVSSNLAREVSLGRTAGSFDT